jgi:hypothetical protein
VAWQKEKEPPHFEKAIKIKNHSFQLNLYTLIVKRIIWQPPKHFTSLNYFIQGVTMLIYNINIGGAL